VVVAKKEGNEFFQMVKGVKTDTHLHGGLLGRDDKNTFNLNDPRQLAERMAAVKARVERRKREAEAKGRG
jgi:hypothetical protein